MTIQDVQKNEDSTSPAREQGKAMLKEHTINVLLVEDTELEVEAVRRAFATMRIVNPLFVAGDGLEALAMLRGEAGNTAIPYPRVILLDLNLPRMNGLEFLDELRNDPKLRDSVVFMLTTSSDDRDKAAAYKRHIAGYVVKPTDGDYDDLRKIFENYWKCVELPPDKDRV